MPKGRLLTGSHSRDENGSPVSYVAGEVLELSDAELTGDSLKGRIELIADGEDDTVDLSLMSAAKASALISSLETIDEVVAFQSAEAGSKKPRPTVIAAAEKRLRQLASGG